MSRTIRYIVIAVGIISLIGLSWWYFFLKDRINSQKNQDVARGYGADVPSFSSPTGSTYQNVQTSVTGTSSVSVTQSGSVPELWHVSVNPAAGVGFSRTEGSESMYFVERATGYVFYVDQKTGSVIRRTNTLMPKIYEAYISAKNGIVLRNLSQGGRMQTYLGTIPQAQTDATTSAASLSGAYIESDVRDVAVDTKTQQIFYIAQDAQSGPIGVTRDWPGKNSKRVFSASLIGWHPIYLPDGRMFVVQYSTDDTAGAAYEVKSGGLESILANIQGLTFLPQSSSEAYIYGISSRGQTSLYAKPSKKENAVLLPVKTIADKCVWSTMKGIVYCAVPDTLPGGLYLQNLHMGALHTSDTWWKINVQDGSAEVLVSNQGFSFDVERPVINDSGTAIAFINASDKSVWRLKIPQ